jgi:hypothetical protein
VGSYRRQLSDIPCGGPQVRITVTVRRFKCVEARCAQSTFCAQIPGLTAPFARRTPTLTKALVEIALSLAGRPGSRLAGKLAMRADAGEHDLDPGVRRYRVEQVGVFAVAVRDREAGPNAGIL